LGWTPLDIYGDNANIAYPRWIAAVPKEDFDIDSLAVYLHLTPQQVMRLADRGKVPGRKVAGQWRFSQAEIHHWLEDRIGLSDEVELAEMETVLERSHAAEDSVSISQLLHRDAIAIPLEARTRNSVINAMTRLAAGTGLLWDPEKMAEAVSERENLHPTALDNGVALLHPRRPMESILAEPLLALGCTSSGIPFGGSGLNDIFFLICSTDDRVHLRVLARLSRLVADGEMLEAIRTATTPEEALDAIVEAEKRLP
jgi:PTS system nitrogen regulatory IIA component